MTKRMPKQRPATSEQSVGTPKVFTNTVLKWMGLKRFAVDLAADHSNAVCEPYFTVETDAFTQRWSDWCGGVKGWAWLNPPFSDIAVWAERAHMEATFGAYVIMLVPAATDTSWWETWVDGKAYVVMIRGRFAFVGHKDQYPKGLALLLYAPFLGGGYRTWDWKYTAQKVQS